MMNFQQVSHLGPPACMYDQQQQQWMQQQQQQHQLQPAHHAVNMNLNVCQKADGYDWNHPAQMDYYPSHASNQHWQNGGAQGYAPPPPPLPAANCASSCSNGINDLPPFSPATMGVSLDEPLTPSVMNFVEQNPACYEQQQLAQPPPPLHQQAATGTCSAKWDPAPADAVLDTPAQAPPAKVRAQEVIPITDDWPGTYEFDVKLAEGPERGPGCMWSDVRKKIYIELDRECRLVLTYTSPGENLLLRVMPVFTSSNAEMRPVRRCPTHADPRDKTNARHAHPEHVVRISGPQERLATYVENEATGRLSVVVPVRCPAGGQFVDRVGVRFMCLGTCRTNAAAPDKKRVGKTIGAIFTLERETGEVVGRKTLNVRVCACPARDKQAEENPKTGPRSGKGLKRKAPTSTGAPSAAAADIAGKQRFMLGSGGVAEIMAIGLGALGFAAVPRRT